VAPSGSPQRVGRRVSCCRKEGLPGPELVRVNIQMLWSKASEGVFSPDSEEEKGRNSGKKRSGVAQVRECLPSKGKAQVQTPVLPKKKKKSPSPCCVDRMWHTVTVTVS
jgi:hypothetical protein